MAQDKYLVAVTIRIRKVDGTGTMTFEPGSIVSFEDDDNVNVESLIRQGSIAPYKEPKKPKVLKAESPNGGLDNGD